MTLAVERQNYPRRRLHGGRSHINGVSIPSTFKDECRDRGESLGARCPRAAGFLAMLTSRRVVPFTPFGPGGAGGWVTPPVDNSA